MLFLGASISKYVGRVEGGGGLDKVWASHEYVEKMWEKMEQKLRFLLYVFLTNDGTYSKISTKLFGLKWEEQETMFDFPKLGNPVFFESHCDFAL